MANEAGTLSITTRTFARQSTPFKLVTGGAMIPAPLFIGWAIALYCALVALLKWKYRRYMAQQRITKGLRAYTATGHQMAMGAMG